MSVEHEIRAVDGLSELYGALSAAQGEFPAIPRSREVLVRMKSGGTYTFKYAPLDVILGAVRPALAKHGLAVTQTVAGNDAGLLMRTTIAHKGGGSCVTDTPLPPYPADPQQVGSMLTYFRRYSLTIALGIAAEEDDDANAAVGNHADDAPARRAAPTRPAPQRQATPAKPARGPAPDGPPSPQQLDELTALLESVKPAEDAVNSWFDKANAARAEGSPVIETYDQMKHSTVVGICNWLKAQKTKATPKAPARGPARTVAV